MEGKMKKFRLEEVFVPAGYPKYTYSKRADLEKKLNMGKINKAKHLLVFGPSKCGKSSLWKNIFSEMEIIKIPLNSNKSLDDVYCEILEDLEAYYTADKLQELSLKSSFLGDLKAKLSIMFEARTQIGLESSYKESEKKVKVARQVIASNLVIKYLKPTKKTILFEDYHYANEDLKTQLAQDLKAFSDDNCQIIFISVQHKITELLKYNHDLQLRVTSIPVGFFEPENLHDIIQTGERLLNIEFAYNVKQMILNEAMNSAALTQDICQKICLENSILETANYKKVISDIVYVSNACKLIAEENRAFYEEFSRLVIAGGRSDGTTEKYKWFLKMIKEYEIGDQGISNTEVLQKLKTMGHTSINQTSVTTGLDYLPKLIIKRNLSPLFDYDSKTNTFFVMDKYIHFVYKWAPDIVENYFK